MARAARLLVRKTPWTTWVHDALLKLKEYCSCRTQPWRTTHCGRRVNGHWKLRPCWTQRLKTASLVSRPASLADGKRSCFTSVSRHRTVRSKSRRRSVSYNAMRDLAQLPRSSARAASPVCSAGRQMSCRQRQVHAGWKGPWPSWSASISPRTQVSRRSRDPISNVASQELPGAVQKLQLGLHAQ
jgi:hypothetical protein